MLAPQIINIPENQSYTYYFYLTNTVSGLVGQPLAGVLFAPGSCQISHNGATFVSTTNLPTEIGNGWYQLVLTAAEMNFTNNLLNIAYASGTFTQLFSGLNAPSSGFAVDNLGHVWTWGFGGNGILGNNSTNNVSFPVIVKGNISFTKIFVSGTAVYGLDAQGHCWAWGQGTSGQLGNNSIANASSPVSVVGGISFTKIFVNNTSTVLGLDGAGNCWAWGSGTNGVLGNNSTNNVSSPVLVLGGITFTQISFYSSNGAVLGLDTLGHCWAWGQGTTGQLGNNTLTASSSPVSVVGGISFTQILATQTNGYALDGLGHCWAWGQGATGLLGNQTITTSSSPVSVVGGFVFTQIFAISQQNAYGLDAQGHLWSWGAAGNGVLGNNANANVSSPVSVVGGISFSQIYANPNGIVLGLDGSGNCWTWGPGTSGLLGNNTVTSASSPVLVVGGISFTKVVSSNNPCIYALDGQGNVWSWGAGVNGALGNTSLSNTSSPVLVSRLGFDTGIDNVWLCTTAVGGGSLTAAQVWDYLISSGFTAGSIGEFLASLTAAPTTAQIQAYLEAHPIDVNGVNNPVSVSNPLTAAQVWEALASATHESASIGALIQSQLATLVAGQGGSAPTLAQIKQVVETAFLTFGKS